MCVINVQGLSCRPPKIQNTGINQRTSHSVAGELTPWKIERYTVYTTYTHTNALSTLENDILNRTNVESLFELEFLCEHGSRIHIHKRIDLIHIMHIRRPLFIIEQTIWLKETLNKCGDGVKILLQWRYFARQHWEWEKLVWHFLCHSPLTIFCRLTIQLHGDSLRLERTFVASSILSVIHRIEVHIKWTGNF